MTMESGAENQQSGDAAVTEAENQQMAVQAQPQIATLAQVSMPAAHATSSAPTVTLVQLPNGQTVQVHGVIQAAQPSVIQSPQVQTVQSSCKNLKRLFSGTQISTIAESEDSQESVDSVTDSQKRREILSRRPSYRKILNDLSSDAPGVPRIEEEKSEEETSAPAITTVTVPTPIYQTSSGQYIAITQGGAIQLANNGTDGVQGLQTLTMTNAAATQPGTTILQYAQTTDGQQILVPSNQVVVQVYLKCFSVNLPLSMEDSEDCTLSRKISQAGPCLPFRLKLPLAMYKRIRFAQPPLAPLPLELLWHPPQHFPRSLLKRQRERERFV
ncbi:cyclic AMP-responsive element-binding protein 1 isoform X3 [Echinops telfairi]|uniref:Cyclic AMP-responsive element-binding protein 1 isoform X3 n=1 Tax=Echinops telfairi TaxID=9371 RepID=A0AC55DGP6_ECHTE|nr:cyclic AMP-responsive element-binding protein 1 isoform X3 [Echinops telfairi]